MCVRACAHARSCVCVCVCVCVCACMHACLHVRLLGVEQILSGKKAHCVFCSSLSLSLFVSVFFNYTYYTKAHKCNMRQPFAIPAWYENKHCPSETGRSVHACSNTSSFFLLFLLFDRVLLSARLLMLTF